MKVVIVEDERSAVINLTYLLEKFIEPLEIIQVLDTVSESVSFFNQTHDIDLVFMDIHLADGNSFQIFELASVSAPIIFITAFDSYAIKAFKVNSIDYLLKPLQEADLEQAIAKFQQNRPTPSTSSRQLTEMLKGIQTTAPTYRQSFLLQKGDTLLPVKVEEFAFFSIQNGVVRGTTMDNTIYFFSEKMEELEKEIDPSQFYRANRQYIVQRNAIKSVSLYFNGRLIVNCMPNAEPQIIISKAKASDFKYWLAK